MTSWLHITHRVLVPIDGSKPSVATLERHPEATITALYVVDPIIDYSRRRAYPGYRGTDEFTTEREKTEAVLESLTDRYEARTDRITREIEVGKPPRIVVKFAKVNSIDRIILGSHGYDSAARVFFGNVAETVVRRASVPVTVVR